MTTDQSTEFRKQLLDTFKFTIDFLNSHHLRWWVAYGTAIGAVRHHGLIPWDDDIDIHMPRADYEKLVQLAATLPGQGYELCTIQTNPGYYCPFAKLMKTGTTLWEFKKFRFPLGVYVDIFPLDYYHYTENELTKVQRKHAQLFTNYQKALQCHSIKDYIHNLCAFQFKTVAKHLHFLLFFRTRQQTCYRQYIKTKTLHCADESGELCVSFTQYIGNICKSSWFKDYIEMPFEDFTVRVPIGYDAYLTKLYGDYMTPPSIEKRQPMHKCYYTNLNKRLSIQEIEEEMKRIHASKD